MRVKLEIDNSLDLMYNVFIMNTVRKYVKTKVNKRTQDLTNKRFGRWVVLDKAEPYRKPTGQSLCPRWNCICDCGTKKAVATQSLLRQLSTSCGCFAIEQMHTRIGENHHAWKGGIIEDGNGYIQVKAPNHPKVNRGGYVREHVLVMEKKIGRYLNSTETVHHKNGIRSDNRVDNLELWASNHPPGQRVEDLVTWANSIIALYGDKEN